MEYIDPSWKAYFLGNIGAYGAALAKRELVTLQNVLRRVLNNIATTSMV